MLFEMGMCKVSIARHNLLFLHEMLVNCWWHNRAIIHNIHLLSLCGGYHPCWGSNLSLPNVSRYTYINYYGYTASFKKHNTKKYWHAQCAKIAKENTLSCEQLPPETPKELKTSLFISISKLWPNPKTTQDQQTRNQGTITRLLNFPKNSNKHDGPLMGGRSLDLTISVLVEQSLHAAPNNIGWRHWRVAFLFKRSFSFFENRRMDGNNTSTLENQDFSDGIVDAFFRDFFSFSRTICLEKIALDVGEAC